MNRWLIYVPEINRRSFVLFYFKGTSGSSWSVHEYLGVAHSVRHAKDFPLAWTSDRILEMTRSEGCFAMPAPTVSTENVGFWRERIDELNREHLGVAPSLSAGPTADQEDTLIQHGGGMHELLAVAKRPAVNQVSGFAEEAARLSIDAVTDAYRRLRSRSPRRRAAGKSYFVGHTGFPSMDRGVSNRSEEHFAMALFNHHPASGVWLLPDGRSLRVLDYQFPLKARRGDAGVGKVDLLGVIDRTAIAVAELKHVDQGTASRGDTPLRALLEVLGYCAIVEANLSDIALEMTSTQLERPIHGVEMLVVGSEWYWEKWEQCIPAGAWQPALSALSSELSAALGVPIRFLSLRDPAFEMGSIGRKPCLTGNPTLNSVTGLPS